MKPCPVLWVIRRFFHQGCQSATLELRSVKCITLIEQQSNDIIEQDWGPYVLSIVQTQRKRWSLPQRADSARANLYLFVLGCWGGFVYWYNYTHAAGPVQT